MGEDELVKADKVRGLKRQLTFGLYPSGIENPAWFLHSKLYIFCPFRVYDKKGN